MDSQTFENPFRDGGKLSRDAEDILLAVKTGKLSIVSNNDKHDAMDEDNIINKESITGDEKYQVSPSLVKPCNRKNAVIDNMQQQRNTASTSSSVQKGSCSSINKKKKHRKCCTVL